MKNLSSVIFSDLTPVRFVAAVINLTFGLGYLFLDSSTGNYAHLLAVMPAYLWGLSLILYSAVKFAAIFGFIQTGVRKFLDIFGIWLWTFTFMSFVVIDNQPILASEPITAIIALMHVWLLTERKHS